MHRAKSETSRALSPPPPSRGRHAAHPEPLPSASTPAELACARLVVDAGGAPSFPGSLRFQRCFVAKSALAQATRLEAVAGFHPLAPTRAQLTDFCNPYDSRTRPNESSEPRPPLRRSPVGAALFSAGGDSLPSRLLELNGRQPGFPRLGPNASALPGSNRSSKSDWLARGTSPQPLPPCHPSSLADARPGWRPRSSEPHRALGSTRLGQLPTVLREEPGQSHFPR
jgi:hypothetical protein